MFSKILVKLVDQAIIPAILLLAVRVVSVVGLSSFFDKPLSVGSSGFTFANPSDYIFVNSYSALTMVVVLAIGVLFILTKSFLFHDTHIEPALTAKLFSLRLSSFIQTSFDLYSQGLVWVSYLYLMMFVSAVMAFFGVLYSWVFVVSFVLTILSTVLFVYDVEREVELNSESFAGLTDLDDEDEEYVLKFERRG